ncbi:MAG: PD40 domain-containing protein [Fibrobacteres bacterium]|nr:PD40 domain-containing protein [Fibrobacterota bacterium]
MKTILLVLLTALSAYAQFGQNKVQYDKSKWITIQTPHFDVYYSDYSKEQAVYAAAFLEKALDSITRSVDYHVKKRIPVIIYRSQSEFMQTNVILEELSEGVGGFTEVFKSRVVVPFTGSWPDFHHVLHHELVHAVMYDLIFENVVNAFRARTSFQIPLWVAEGWAEYESAGWNLESDMYLMDALLYGYIAGPEYEFGSQYLAYKAGCAFYNFLSRQYGRESIGKFLKYLAVIKNVERAFKRATGEDLQVAGDLFIKDLKKRYWPELGKREAASSFARKLTSHRAVGNSFLSADRGRDPLAHFNIQPSVSPDGKQIAYFSDREDYPSIFVMNAQSGKITGKLAVSGSSDNFESFHSFKSGIAWSPDGKKICIVAQSQGEDVLRIISSINGKVLETLPFSFDRIEHPDWSKDGGRIVFGVQHQGQSDLYYFDYKTSAVVRLTSDENYDTYPRFSPDGTKILFESETQKDRTGGSSGTDLFLLHIAEKRIQRLTDHSADDKMAIFADSGRSIIFISDRSGIANIYKLDPVSLKVSVVTNTYSGCFNPSMPVDSRFMAFSLFENGGWDVYRMERPLDRTADTMPEPTKYAASLLGDTSLAFWRKVQVPPPLTDSLKVDSGKAKKKAVAEDEDDSLDNVWQRSPSIFNDPFSSSYMPPQRDARLVSKYTVDTSDFLHDSTLYKNKDGSYIDRDYVPKFSFDAIAVAVGGAYSPYGASIAGQGAFLLSDILGNHRIYVAANMYGSGLEDPLSALNGMIQYAYLPYRTDFNGLLMRYTNTIYAENGDSSFLYLDAVNEARVDFSYPLSVFARLDGGIGYTLLTRNRFGIFGNDTDGFVELPKKKMPSASYADVSASFVFDNTLWGSTGPVKGERFRVTGYLCPNTGETPYGFGVALLDFREYFRFLRKYTVALRLNGGASHSIGNGINPKKFYLGGLQNDLSSFFDPYIFDGSVDDNYFSSLIMPLRGYSIGGVNPDGNTKYALANLELRFPFIDYLIMHVPPIGFSGIAATAFLDAGTAWNDINDVRLTKNGHLHSLKAGAGFGIRAHLIYGMLFKWDRAWRLGNDKGHEDYFSIGAEF